jgi:K(+)-stimulated pyrophosphate-energized sodium pump
MNRFLKRFCVMFDQEGDSPQGVALLLVFGLVALVVAVVIGVGIRSVSVKVSGPAAPVALSAGPATLAAGPGNAANPASAASVAGAAITASVATVAGVASSASAENPAPASPSAAQATSDAAGIEVEQNVVQFYFASGKADLAAGASDALDAMVQSARSGRTLVITGFHDATGSAAKNAELARQRAQAVRNALKAAGVAEAKMVLKKPQAVSGSDAQARRVEISLQ